MGSGISSHFGKKSKNRQPPPTATSTTSTVVDGPTSLSAAATDRPYIVPLDLPPVISTPRNVQFISDLEGKKICVPYTPGIDKCFTKDTEMIIQSGILEDITCPHCVHYGFQISFVSDCDEVRDYSRNVPLLKLENSTGSGSSKNNLPLPSPLRVGESFEDLKRKMVPYKLQNKLHSVASESRIDESATHVSPRVDSFSTHGSPKPEDENTHEHLLDPISLFHDRGQIDTAVPSTDTVPSSEDEAAIGRSSSRMEHSPMQTAAVSPIDTSAIADGSGDLDSDELSEATPLPVRNPSSDSQCSPSQSQLYELSSFSLNLEQSMTEIRAVVIPHTTLHTQAVVDTIREEQ
eukprot:gene23871-32263_t